MKRLAEMDQHAAQRAQGKTQEAGPTGATGVQEPDLPVLTRTCGDADHVGFGDPVAALHGGIADGKNAICSFFVNCASVQDKPAVNLIKYNASTVDRADIQRLDENAVSVADGRMHAGPLSVKGDGRALLEQRGEDGLDIAHDGDGFRVEKVVQAMSNTSIVFRAGRLALAGCLLSWTAQAAKPTGEAIVAAMTGRAQARVFTAPVHEGRTELMDLFEGASVGENVRVITGKDGRLCLVCSPGAILCVAPNTEFVIDQLRHTADGLPESEDDLIRRIHVRLLKGRLRVQAGTPLPTLDLRIDTSAGRVEAHGGAFVVAQGEQDRWHVACEAHELAVVPRNGSRTELKANQAAWLAADGEERGAFRWEDIGENPELYQFELCNAFFADLEPFIHHERPFDREGLGQYIGATAPFLDLDAGALVTDASPTIRPAVAAVRPAALPRPGEGAPGGRWDEIRIWKWFDDLGTVKGVNYIPRTAVNSVEMWMEDTFDPDTIDEELGWARDVGYTGIRVQLQFAVWQDDPDGFLDRVDRLLEIAAKHGLRVVPVLFDDLNRAGQAPHVGPQPEPLPGEHNARWVPSPGAAAVKDRGQWPALEKYVKDVMGKFKRDRRVLYWDLYNVVGNGGLGEESLPLLDQTFNWARAVEPSQPLAVPAWREFGGAMTARGLERSDLITFQSFDDAESVAARLQLLQRYQRPIICSDWLMRQTGNDFENVLPLFSTYRAGWFNQGLVSGKTHRPIQEAAYRTDKDPDLWQQDVLHPDGTPYDHKEVELIQGFRYLEAP